MDRRTRTIIVVALAMALASAASFGVYRAILTRPVREVPIAERFTVVATQTIPVGVLILKEMVRVAPWPADSAVDGGFASVEEVLGRGVTVGLVKNEPIIETKLAPKGSGGGLPPTITPGMRAISVKVNDVISVAGFTVPGTHVDVIVTLQRGQESMSRTVLSNVQVLAAGTNMDSQKSREGQAVPATVVTLLLTPADAERLALASNQGQMHLALRNPLDVEKTETAGIRVSSLLGSLSPEPVKTMVKGQARVVTPAPPPAPKPYTVEAIRGAKVTQEIIKK